MTMEATRLSNVQTLSSCLFLIVQTLGPRRRIVDEVPKSVQMLDDGGGRGEVLGDDGERVGERERVVWKRRLDECLVK